MKQRDCRANRRAAAKEAWQAGPQEGGFPEHWRALNDEHHRREAAEAQRRKAQARAN